MRRYLILLIILLLYTCDQRKNSKNPLVDILNSNHPAIKTVMDNLDAHELQIQLTDINADTTYTFQVSAENYFYPASSVKFPIAVLALEKVNTLNGITSETPFIVGGDSTYSTIRSCVTKIFATSDNKAYNDLYEFLGRDYINSKLKEKGLQPARISHRLSTPHANIKTTKPISFKITDSTIIKQEPIIDSEIEKLNLKKINKGKGFYKDDALVNTPFDFSQKNYLPISVLHDMMKRIQFPNTFKLDEQFILNPEDRSFLLDIMKKVPREVGYNEADYYDGYVKFFMFGDTKKRIPEHINISNKVGYAYGYLTDCAFIEDKKQEVSFILTATIHVNNNEIFNDDVYEYEEIGIPFLAEIGRQVHTYYTKK